jgi:hypothetical protein
MRAKLSCGVAAAVLGLLVFAATAAANGTTLGITAQPSGSSASACGSDVIGQNTDDPATPYHVPAGGGTITQWQTVTTGETPGAPLTFAVLRATSGGNFAVVGADSETIPNPLPSSGVATYTLPAPISVQAGDTLALYSTSSGVDCYFFHGSTPAGDSVFAATDASPPPSAGQTLTVPSASPGDYTTNLAATLVQQDDAAVSTSAGPSGASAGQASLLASTVINDGPASAAITFTDGVPGGLAIDSAVGGDGTCSVSGQTVSCEISGLGAGQSAPVDVVVTPSSPGTYVNRVSVAVAPGVTDPDAANNSASATLSVGRSVPAKCVVPRLKGATRSFARTLLKDLGCQVRTRHAHSKSVRKGSVVKTKPGPGSYAYQRTVMLVVSSGPKKRHG